MITYCEGYEKEITEFFENTVFVRERGKGRHLEKNDLYKDILRSQVKRA